MEVNWARLKEIKTTLGTKAYKLALRPLLTAVVTILATVFRVLHLESPSDIKIWSLIN